MADYNRDEMERKEKLGKDELPYKCIELELDDKQIVSLALMAQNRDITLNKMIGIALRDGLERINQSTPGDPQLLAENY